VKRWMAKLLLSGVVTLALLCLLEGVCRLALPAPDKVRLPPKEQGAFRVVALGGSTVYGTPIPEFGIVAMLEHELEQMLDGARLDLINLGKPGADSQAVLARLRQALAAQPDLVIVLMGHNEYLDRKGEHPDWRADLLDRARGFALGRALDSAAARIRDPRQARHFVMPDRLEPYDRASAWFQGRQERFRRSLLEALELCQRAGVPILLCTAPFNLADWPPVHEDIAWASPIPAYDRLLADLAEQIAEGRLEEAKQRAEQSLSQYGEDAMLLYVKGKIAQAEARDEEALELFRRAKDLDPYPWRALTLLNDMTRSFSGAAGAAVADVEEAFLKAAPGGLVGFDLVADNCHPTPLGSAVAAAAIAGRIRELNWLPGLSAARAPKELLEDYLGGLNPPGREAELWLEWRLQNALYCMKSPFYFFSASMKYLDDALASHPQDWRLYANRATVHWLEGRIEEGRADLSRALDLKGGPLDVEDRAVTPYLKEALEKARQGGA